ncbi:periplasmic binding protein-like I [Dichotomocladium elegans]|nr:periplasmic binding protein-like I [Dichotomocladium elegans]
MATNASFQVPNTATISFHVDNRNGQLYEYSITRNNTTTIVSPRHPNQPIEIKIGVLLPFHQTQDNWTRELTLSGSSAIRLAASNINRDGLLPGAYVTLIEQDSYPKDVQGQSAIFEAVVATMALVQQGVVGVIGDISSSWTALSALITSTLQIPQCSFSATASSFDQTQYHHFYRTAATSELFADAALAFLNSQGWPSFSLLYSSDDYGNLLSQAALMKAKANGVRVKGYQAFYQDSDTLQQVVQDIQSFLAQVGVRIVFIAAEGEAQHTALIMAAHMGYMDTSHVWIVLGDVDDGDSLKASVDRFNSVLLRRSQYGTTLENLDALAASDVTNDSLETKTTGLTMLPLEYYAWTTPDLAPINYQAVFSGGVFGFRRNMNLTGYPPYDEFQAAWSALDPVM